MRTIQKIFIYMKKADLKLSFFHIFFFKILFRRQKTATFQPYRNMEKIATELRFWKNRILIKCTVC